VEVTETEPHSYATLNTIGRDEIVPMFNARIGDMNSIAPTGVLQAHSDTAFKSTKNDWLVCPLYRPY